jgi:hypothetical protein
MCMRKFAVMQRCSQKQLSKLQTTMSKLNSGDMACEAHK